MTAGTGGGGIEFQQRVVAPTTEAGTRFVSMLIIDPSDLQASDFFYEEDTTDLVLTATYQTAVSKTDLSHTDGDEWIVFSCTGFDIETTIYNSKMRMVLEHGSGSVEDTPVTSFEGKNNNEYMLWAMCRGYTLTAEDPIFKIEVAMDEVAPTPNTKTYASMFGLRLNAFENYFQQYTSTPYETYSIDWVELDTKDFTTTDTGKVLVFANAIADLDAMHKESFGRIQLDDTTSPNAIPDTQYQVNTRDGSSELPMFLLTSYTGTGSVSVQIDLDAKKEATGVTSGWLGYSLMGFSTDLMQANRNQVFSAVASQTYNSGEVAGQTYSSGDEIGQVQPK